MDRYTRAELADVSGVASRTIRYYHSLGVLPRPGRAGKEVVYTDEHLDRLRDIVAMQARGLRLDAIREVFDTEPQAGDWRTLFDPRAGQAIERSSYLDDAELVAMLGERGTDVLTELASAGYLEQRGAQWFVADRTMLKAALVLYDVGIDVTLSGVLRTLIQSRIAELADEVVGTVRDAAETGYGGEGVGVDLSRFRDRLLAMAWAVGGATFAAEVERAAAEDDTATESDTATRPDPVRVAGGR
ncbi:MerR family transcriptional regulator [Nocardia alba]|uniref:MerR-like DNA binding protein n=1 Tax=Nocardia alba TaxID=225051 RepID=A0A4R1FTH6_9NOCA|nr:MerR family transcriptional regulator [Nocardia alba]TCJ96889.1 MerR-like DNA binding protein [Nocardia alba]